MAPASRRVPLVFPVSYCGRDARGVNGGAPLSLLGSRANRKREGDMPGEFQDKVVVITGGSRGIGRAIAVAFAREGASCVLASSSAANLAAAAKTVAGAGGAEPLTVAGDLRTLAGCEQGFAPVDDAPKRRDVLVNRAGATPARRFLSIPAEAWLPPLPP